VENARQLFARQREDYFWFFGYRRSFAIWRNEFLTGRFLGRADSHLCFSCFCYVFSTILCRGKRDMTLITFYIAGGVLLFFILMWVIIVEKKK